MAAPARRSPARHGYTPANIGQAPVHGRQGDDERHPALLMLAQGRTTAPPSPKDQAKGAVAKLLRDHFLPEWQWTQVPSGELRDVRTAVKLKRMGVRRGWPALAKRLNPMPRTEAPRRDSYR